jgi:hypothetical protein
MQFDMEAAKAAGYSDEEISQFLSAKNIPVSSPSTTPVVTPELPVEVPQTVGSAAKRALLSPFSAARKLATDPETMAKALPLAMGTAGLGLGPAGAAIGGAAGSALSNLALTGLGSKSAPQVEPGEVFNLQTAGEAIGSGALGLLGNPSARAVGKGLVSSAGRVGDALGDIERAAKVYTNKSIPVPERPEAVSATINSLNATAELIKRGVKQSPQMMRDQLEVIDKLFKAGASGRDGAILAKSAETIRGALNQAIPGRADRALAVAVANQRNRLIGSPITKIGGAVLGGSGLGALLTRALASKTKQQVMED